MIALLLMAGIKESQIEQPQETNQVRLQDTPATEQSHVLINHHLSVCQHSLSEDMNACLPSYSISQLKALWCSTDVQ